jgi:hypothetical protein
VVRNKVTWVWLEVLSLFQTPQLCDLSLVQARNVCWWPLFFLKSSAKSFADLVLIENEYVTTDNIKPQ